MCCDAVTQTKLATSEYCLYLLQIELVTTEIRNCTMRNKYLLFCANELLNNFIVFLLLAMCIKIRNVKENCISLHL